MFGVLLIIEMSQDRIQPMTTKYLHLDDTITKRQ